MKKLFPLFILAAAASSGCAVGTDQENPVDTSDPVADVEQPFLEAECPTLTPDAFITTTGHGKTGTARTNGTNYGTDSRCKNAFKVNVRANLAPTASVYVYWQPPFPASQSACQGAKVFLRLFEKVGTSYKLRAATSGLPSWDGSRCNGLYAWSDVQNIGNGNNWMAIAEGIGSDNKLRPIEVMLLAY